MLAWIIALSLLVIQMINLCTILIMIFRRRDEPIYIIAWTMIMTFIPFIGFLLYLLFGHGPIIKKKRTFLDEIEELGYQEAVDSQLEMVEQTSANYFPYTSLIEFNLNYNKSVLTRYNSLTYFSDANDKYEQLMKDIEQATDTIHVLYFIIRGDHSGKALIEALTKKAKQGVKVRLVYDDGGSFLTPSSVFRPLKEAGGIVVKHYPAKFKIFTLNWNYRNHRKIVVIDGKIGYFGGMNIGDEYLSKNPKYTPWRDAHLRVKGEMVKLLQLRFLKDYAAVIEEVADLDEVEQQIDRYFPPISSEEEEMYMQLVCDGPDQKTDHMRAAYIKLIMSAKKSIWIQSPYFIPDSEFLHVLKIASHSGLDVKIMIPVIPDNHFVHRTTTSYIKELLEANIEVYFYEGFLHSKVFIIDEEMATVGSVNMDVRSFSINFELAAFIYHEKMTSELVKQFKTDQLNCQKLDWNYEQSKSWFMKAEESVYRLLSMLM